MSGYAYECESGYVCIFKFSIVTQQATPKQWLKTVTIISSSPTQVWELTELSWVVLSWGRSLQHCSQHMSGAGIILRASSHTCPRPSLEKQATPGASLGTFLSIFFFMVNGRGSSHNQRRVCWSAVSEWSFKWKTEGEEHQLQG